MQLGKKIITGTSVALCGLTLAGCSPSGTVSKGTVYEYTYSKNDATYILSAVGNSCNVEGKTGSITVYADNKGAYLKNFAYYQHLYSDGEAIVKDITNDSITVAFKLKAGENQIASATTAKLSKSIDYIDVPLGFDEHYVKYKKKTK